MLTRGCSEGILKAPRDLVAAGRLFRKQAQNYEPTRHPGSMLFDYALRLSILNIYWLSRGFARQIRRNCRCAESGARTCHASTAQ